MLILCQNNYFVLHSTVTKQQMPRLLVITIKQNYYENTRQQSIDTEFENIKNLLLE